MDTNSTASLMADTQEAQNMITQAISEAVKAFPRPKLPSWMEVAAEFIKVHPWISLGVVVVIISLISMIIREILCSYFKTNEILTRLKKIEEKLK